MKHCAACLRNAADLIITAIESSLLSNAVHVITWCRWLRPALPCGPSLALRALTWVIDAWARTGLGRRRSIRYTAEFRIVADVESAVATGAAATG